MAIGHWTASVHIRACGDYNWMAAHRACAAGKLPWTDAFVLRLRQLGWIDGRTVTIEYRWAEG
ncbi:MAG: hypothetical protein WBD83_25295, partial [Xanthobacteraceae bacterium]